MSGVYLGFHILKKAATLSRLESVHIPCVYIGRHIRVYGISRVECIIICEVSYIFRVSNIEKGLPNCLASARVCLLCICRVSHQSVCRGGCMIINRVSCIEKGSHIVSRGREYISCVC